MEFKPVPEPPANRAALRTVREAVPRVPKPETDCCRRIQRRVDCITDRDAASDWLTFLRALGLAEAYDRGFARTDDDPDVDDLAERFRDRVYAADLVLDALEVGPMTAAAVYERVEPEVPAWERERSDDWEAVWRERVRRLLDWAVLFEIAERDGDRYRL